MMSINKAGWENQTEHEAAELERLVSMRSRKRETSSELASLAICKQVQQTAAEGPVRGRGKKTFTEALNKLRRVSIAVC